MFLSELVKDLAIEVVTDTEVTGLTCDSREVKPGWLFAAFPGTKLDGRDYIGKALEQGAIALLVPEDTDMGTFDLSSVTVIRDINPRKRFANAADFYGRQPETVIAVTGTNGKTSTVTFARQIWQELDHAAASLGTLGVAAPSLDKSGSLTTPDPVTLHSEITELEAAGITHLAIEASSQGLDQYRLDGLRIKAAGFTNLSLDHLDYHQSMGQYLAAKKRLFSEVLSPGSVAVLNADIPEFKDLEALCKDRGHRVISYGYHGTDIRLVSRTPLPDGQFITIRVFNNEFDITLPLVGEFQTMNCLCALGLVIAEDLEDRLLHMEAVAALDRITGVRGRLEYVGMHPNGASIYVDYAHTPDALKTVLQALLPHTEGNLHAIIGCGGDRDSKKRPEMGAIAEKLADKVIVTDDNPRTEDPAKIRQDVLRGCKTAIEIADRKQAIYDAVHALKAGDVLVITGKGHEQGQIIGDEVIPFDDATQARNAILEIDNE